MNCSFMIGKNLWCSQLYALITKVFNDKGRLTFFTIALSIFFLTRNRALNRKKSELYHIWANYSHKVLIERRPKNEAHHYTQTFDAKKLFSPDECMENFCGVLLDARTLSIRDTNRLYRTACFEVAKITLPEHLQYLEFRNSFVSRLKLCKQVKYLLSVLSSLRGMVFSSNSEVISDLAFDTIKKYPEIIQVLRRDSQEDLLALQLRETFRRISSLFRYIVLGSWEKVFSYLMLISLSTTLQQTKNKIIVSSTSTTFQLELMKMMHRYFGENMTSARFNIIQEGISLCWHFFQSSLIESVVNNFLLRSSLFITSRHRKSMEKKFYKALEESPTRFFDLHTINEIEEMYYYMHDLEGVETQILLQVKNIIQAIFKIVEIQSDMKASIKNVITLIFCNQLVTQASRSISQIWRVIPLEHLACISFQDTDISYELSKNSYHEEEKILFNDQMYRSILSNVKTYRSMGLEGILFDGLRKAYFGKTNFLQSESFSECMIKLRCSLKKCCERNYLCNFLHIFEEQILSKFNDISIELLSVIETCVQSFTFFYFLVQQKEGSYDVSRYILFRLFDAFSSSQRVCCSGVMCELINFHAQKASVLSSFFTKSSQNTLVKPILISTKKLSNTVHDKGWIRFQQIAFKYPNMLPEVFRNVSLKIPLGSFTVVRGCNGAGKSTLFSLLARLYMPSEGEIEIELPQFHNEEKKDHINTEEWKSVVAFLPQEHALLPCSIFTNICCLRQNLLTSDIQTFIEQLELSRDIQNLSQGIHTSIGTDENQVTLSRGQAQKVMLARVFVGTPRIVLLDEPTNFLDTTSKQSLIKTIKRYIAEPSEISQFFNMDDSLNCILKYLPRTVICVSHDETMISHANNVIDFPPNTNSYIV